MCAGGGLGGNLNVYECVCGGGGSSKRKLCGDIGLNSPETRLTCSRIDR